MPSQKETDKTDSISLCYIYVREDRPMLDKLETHLSILQKQRAITNWYGHEIILGEYREQEPETQFNSADIILLLVSPDFLASDYCYSTEMMQALERHERGEACVIPIILHPVSWESTPFGKLQPLPTKGRPIAMWANREKAFVNIADGIFRVFHSFPNGLAQKTKEQWILEGKEHYDGHQYDKALAAYTEALDLDPDDELVRETVGRIQIQLGHYDEALTIYEDLLRTSPSASAYLFKGLVLQRVGRSVEALAAYQKAREYGYSG